MICYIHEEAGEGPCSGCEKDRAEQEKARKLAILEEQVARLKIENELLQQRVQDLASGSRGGW